MSGIADLSVPPAVAGGFLVSAVECSRGRLTHPLPQVVLTARRPLAKMNSDISYHLSVISYPE